MLQVELNTIASSFGCLSTQVCKMHRYIVERAGQPNLDVSNLPENDVTSQIADAIGAAVHAYDCEGAAALFVVQPDEKNSYDQQVHHLDVPACPSKCSPKGRACITSRLCAVVLDVGTRLPITAQCSTYVCVMMPRMLQIFWHCTVKRCGLSAADCVVQHLHACNAYDADSMAAALSKDVSHLTQIA